MNRSEEVPRSSLVASERLQTQLTFRGGTDEQDLSDRRVGSVRDALIEAGVPAYRIRTGAFGDTGLTRDRRVDVLVRTSN